MKQRRRRTALLCVLLVMAGLSLYFIIESRNADDPAPQALDTGLPVPLGDAGESASATPLTDAPATETPSTDPGVFAPPLRYSGQGTWAYAEGRDGETWGGAGTLLRYNVAVEDGLELDVEEFSDTVAGVLSDERSWTAGGAWRFEQVGQGSADFTVYLASPEQRAILCNSTNTTVSCRNGDNVVVNSARWIAGVDHWDDTLDAYREYVVNHEVGHRLGYGHVVCGAEGEPSPVMAQQTFQLAGCVGNAWPFPDGEAYLDGPPGEYGGPDLPPDDFED